METKALNRYAPLAFRSVTAINDCFGEDWMPDENAKMRVAVRTTSLLGCPTYCVGATHPLSAAGHLVDALDAASDLPSGIMVNIAPRSGRDREKNGVDFGWLRIRGTVIATTVTPAALSQLAKVFPDKKLSSASREHLVREVLYLTVAAGPQGWRSQFGSFDLLPYMLHLLAASHELPAANSWTLEEFARPNYEGLAWYVDHPFGNVKTTRFCPPGLKNGQLLETVFGALPFYPQLCQLQPGEPGIVRGSSGYGPNRYLELVINGDNAARRFGIEVGTRVFPEPSQPAS